MNEEAYQEASRIMTLLIKDAKDNLGAQMILMLNTDLNIKIAKLLPPPPCEISGTKLMKLMMLGLYAQAQEFERLIDGN